MKNATSFANFTCGLASKLFALSRTDRESENLVLHSDADPNHRHNLAICRVSGIIIVDVKFRALGVSDRPFSHC